MYRLRPPRKVFLHQIEFNPQDNEEVFWCQECDCNKVSSLHEETGLFFEASGHERSYQFQGEGKFKISTGNFHVIMFAICSECLKWEHIEREE